MSLETVFTVTDYWDGPRKGIANYQGAPHLYECIFDTTEDDYSDLYRLTPIDQQTFRLAMENWEIWLRWRAAFDAGKVTVATHPALPEDKNRHEELKNLLQAVLQSSPNAIVRKAEFVAQPDSRFQPGLMRPMGVRWTRPDSKTSPI